MVNRIVYALFQIHFRSETTKRIGCSVMTPTGKIFV